MLDVFRVLGIGLLLTAALASVLCSLPYLEDCFLFSHPTRWWNVYLFRDKICLLILPVVAAFFSAKRTGLNPFAAGFVTCLIPAILYFGLRYIFNVLTKLEMEREPGFYHVAGYVDPTNLRANLVLVARPMLWAAVMGTCGAGIAALGRRSRARREIPNSDLTG